MTINLNEMLILRLILMIKLIVIVVTDDQMELIPDPKYKDVNCYRRRITSMTRLRDDSYFISSSGQKYWLITDTEDAEDENSRDLKSLKADWHKVDASMYYGLDVECGLQFRDKLVLLNFNDKTNQNEVVFGSLDDWNWTSITWDQFDVFRLVKDRFDWSRSIDDIAIIEESILIFQDRNQTRVDCVFRNDKWVYEVSDGFREVPLFGPFDAVYFGDAHKDTYPLYVVQQDLNRYCICFIKANNEEFPSCEENLLSENSLVPKSKCFVKRDPNRQLMASIAVQMVLLFILVLMMIGFGGFYLWHIWWFDSIKATSTQLNTSSKSPRKRKPKTSPKEEKIGDRSPESDKLMPNQKVSAITDKGRDERLEPTQR